MCEYNTYFLARWFQNLFSFETKEISKPLHIIWSIWTSEYPPTPLVNILLMAGPLSSLAAIWKSATLQTSLVGTITIQYLNMSYQLCIIQLMKGLSPSSFPHTLWVNHVLPFQSALQFLYLPYCYRSTVPDASSSCNYRQFQLFKNFKNVTKLSIKASSAEMPPLLYRLSVCL